MCCYCDQPPGQNPHMRQCEQNHEIVIDTDHMKASACTRGLCVCVTVSRVRFIKAQDQINNRLIIFLAQTRPFMPAIFTGKDGI